MQTAALNRHLAAGRKRLLPCFLFLVFYFSSINVTAQVGTWRNFLAYHDIQQIEASANEVFVMASNDLYMYNLADQSITTFDKTNGMSDVNIVHIRWCSAAKKLLVVYKNGNIDLLTANGDITNISDLHTKAIIGDKTVNNVTISGEYGYLACGFGIVKLNIARQEVSESYMLGANVQQVAIEGGSIYAKTSDKGILTGLLSKNLIDKSNWTAAASFPATATGNTAYAQYYDTVAQLSPGGPKYNYFHKMKVVNGKLYTVGGGWYQFGNFQRPGTIQILDANHEWTVYNDNVQPAFAPKYVDLNDIAVDPRDEEHVMCASASGIYEFQDGQFVANYTMGNNDYMVSAASNNNPAYVRTDGIIYDQQGNLYCLNSGSISAIVTLSAGGQWGGILDSQMEDRPGRSMRTLCYSMFDSKGRFWFCNAHTDLPALIHYDFSTGSTTVYKTFVNQDGTSIPLFSIYCIAEDMDGNIWLATDEGPLYLTEAEISDPSRGFLQYKVPRNDGTNLADYLLTGINISCIAMDKAGRKWFGTHDNGVYLISMDNNSQVQHFTTANSSLLSDEIESIAINDDTGEVFFGTANGLCSYMSNATRTNDDMNTDNVWAYPNPVTPDYTGLITVTGLSFNSDVKIVAPNGALIAQGRSNGGMFTWDGCDAKGSPVSSGVYMVLTAKSDGSKGTVCKIAIVR